MVNPLATLGLGLIVGGLALPLAVAPLYNWLARTLRGAQMPAGYLISGLLPGAALSAMCRLEPTWSERHLALLAILGSLNVGLGYLLALRSSQIVDTLSGILIAQSGSSILALTIVRTAGWNVLFYVTASSSLSLACLWALVINARQPDGQPIALEDIAGLGRRRPWLAAAVTLCLLNLVAIPPLAGGMGQIALYRAVATAGRGWVLTPAAIGRLLSWFLAGRWLRAIWQLPLVDRRWVLTTSEIAVVAILAAIGSLLGGIGVKPLLNWIATLASTP
jgi:NADH-quinone oxidoreductase subunit N